MESWKTLRSNHGLGRFPARLNHLLAHFQDYRLDEDWNFPSGLAEKFIERYDNTIDYFMSYLGPVDDAYEGLRLAELKTLDELGLTPRMKKILPQVRYHEHQLLAALAEFEMTKKSGNLSKILNSGFSFYRSAVIPLRKEISTKLAKKWNEIDRFPEQSSANSPAYR